MHRCIRYVHVTLSCEDPDVGRCSPAKQADILHRRDYTSLVNSRKARQGRLIGSICSFFRKTPKGNDTSKQSCRLSRLIQHTACTSPTIPRSTPNFQLAPSATPLDGFGPGLNSSPLATWFFSSNRPIALHDCPNRCSST